MLRESPREIHITIPPHTLKPHEKFHYVVYPGIPLPIDVIEHIPNAENTGNYFRSIATYHDADHTKTIIEQHTLDPNIKTSVCDDLLSNLESFTPQYKESWDIRKAYWLRLLVRHYSDAKDFYKTDQFKMYEQFALAAAIDPEYANLAIIQGLISDDAEIRQLATLFSALPELANLDPVDIPSPETCSYRGVPIIFPTSHYYHGCTYREVAPQVLIIEDSSGSQLEIIELQLVTQNDAIQWHAKSCDESDFAHQYANGNYLSVDQLHRYTTTRDVANLLKCMVEDGIDIKHMPNFLRSRIYLMLGQKRKLDILESVIQEYGPRTIDLLQLTDSSSQADLIGLLHYIEHTNRGNSLGMVDNIVELMDISDKDETGEDQVYAPLIKHKLLYQLKEAINLYNHKDRCFYYQEWELIAASFDALRKTIEASKAIAHGREINLERFKDMAVSLMRRVLDSKLIHVPNIFQTYIELLSAVEISIQQDAEYITGDKQRKKTFYEDYGKDDTLNSVQTTDTMVELRRYFTGIVDRIKAGELPQTLRICVVGMNKGNRFEGPLIELLQSADVAIDFARIVGIDLHDFSEELHPILQQLNTEYVVDDFSREDFDLDEQFDLILLPWSVINDLIATEDIIRVLPKIKKHLTQNGEAWFDGPVPKGSYNPYKNQMEQWAQQLMVWGLIKAQFQHHGKDYETLLNILDQSKLFVLACGATLLPMNPSSLKHLADLFTHLIENEEELINAHINNPNDNASTHPLWHPGRHRMTMILRNESSQRITDETTLTRGLLDLGFALSKNKAEN